MYIIHNMITTSSNNKNINNLTAKEKQAIWRKRQIDIFYGPGRPLLKLQMKTNLYEKTTMEHIILNRDNIWT